LKSQRNRRNRRNRRNLSTITLAFIYYIYYDEIILHFLRFLRDFILLHQNLKNRYRPLKSRRKRRNGETWNITFFLLHGLQPHYFPRLLPLLPLQVSKHILEILPCNIYYYDLFPSYTNLYHI
jgi:hypothetical protein